MMIKAALSARHSSWPWLYLIVSLAALLAYVNSIPNGFVFDDTLVIEYNSALRDPSRWISLFTNDYWGTQYKSGLYRPITLVTYALNHWLFGPGPLSFHAVNVLLHVIVSTLLAAYVARIWTLRAALLVGLLFAVHPVHTEAVAGVVGRAELLMVLFSLLAARAYVQNTPTSLATSLFWGLCAMLSKEQAALLPVFLYVVDRARSAPVKKRQRLLRNAWFLLPLLLVVAAKWAALGSLVPEDGNRFFGDLPAGIRALSMTKIFIFYAKLLFLPIQLCADYGYAAIGEIHSLLDPYVFACCGLLGLFALLLWRLRRSSPLSFTVLTLFLLSLLPISNIVQTGTNMGERLLYLPSVFFCVAIGVWASKELRSTAALLVVCLAFAALTIRRNADWKNAETLFASAIRVAPGSSRSHANYALALFERGKRSEALREVNASLAIAPPSPSFANAIGAILLDAGALERALFFFRDSNRVVPSVLASYNEGIALYRMGRGREATEAFGRSLSLAQANGDEVLPSTALTQMYLGILAAEDGNTAAAGRHFATARRLAPTNPEIALNAGIFLYARGNYPAAIALLQRCIELGRRSAPVLYYLALCKRAQGDAFGFESLLSELHRNFPGFRAGVAQ